MRRRAWVAIAALLLVGCMGGSGGARGVGSRNVITREEIDKSQARTAYDLVRSLRPQWLETRGTSTIGQLVGEEGIVIYMDNARMGLPDSMREITLNMVRFLRFYTAAQATQRWGSGHLHGAILISTQDP